MKTTNKTIAEQKLNDDQKREVNEFKKLFPKDSAFKLFDELVMGYISRKQFESEAQMNNANSYYFIVKIKEFLQLIMEKGQVDPKFFDYNSYEGCNKTLSEMFTGYVSSIIASERVAEDNSQVYLLVGKTDELLFSLNDKK